MDILTDNIKHRKIIIWTALSGLILFALHLIIGRIHVSLMSDVLFQNGFWVRFLPFLQTLLTVCSFALFYGVSSYVLLHREIGKKLFVIMMVVALTLLKYTFTLLGVLWIDGVDTEIFIMLTLPTTLLSFALETVQYAVILIIAWLSFRSYLKETVAQGPIRLLHVSHPLSRSLLLISLTVMLINVASRVVYDIGYGAPSSLAETFRMVSAYTSDVLLYGVLLYVLMHFTVKRIYASQNK